MSGYSRWTSVLVVVALGLVLGCPHLKKAVVPDDGAEKADKVPPPARPSKDSFRLGQYVFYCDNEMKRDLPLFKELVELREQVYKELELPGNDTIVHVYLFGDEDRYRRYMRAKYAGLPDRRAFFIAQPHLGGGEELLVFTFWSDRIRQDLRHELTHALLHCVLKDVPLWLDEGLAEYFELPPSWNGLNKTHARVLREKGVRPDLGRLEQLSDIGKMNSNEYREAWAWVYLMLRGNADAKEALLAYLQQLRTNAKPGALQPRLAAVLPSPDDAIDKQLDAIVADKGKPQESRGEKR